MFHWYNISFFSLSKPALFRASSIVSSPLNEKELCWLRPFLPALFEGLFTLAAFIWNLLIRTLLGKMVCKDSFKKPCTHFFCRWSWITNDSYKHRCIQVDWGAFPSKQNVILFSFSVDGSKWLLLCSLLHLTTKHLNLLRVILVYTTDDSSLRVGLR